MFIIKCVVTQTQRRRTLIRIALTRNIQTQERTQA